MSRLLNKILAYLFFNVTFWITGAFMDYVGHAFGTSMSVKCERAVMMVMGFI